MFILWIKVIFIFVTIAILSNNNGNPPRYGI